MFLVNDIQIQGGKRTGKTGQESVWPLSGICRGNMLKAAGRTDFRLNGFHVCGDHRKKAWRLRKGEYHSCARGNIQTQKKPDASHTHCVKVQPRTCSRDAQRNAQQDTKIQSSCAGISISRAKEFKKLGWFSHNFAEITDERSSKAGPAEYEARLLSINISSNLEKVKRFSTKNRRLLLSIDNIGQRPFGSPMPDTSSVRHGSKYKCNYDKFQRCQPSSPDSLSSSSGSSSSSSMGFHSRFFASRSSSRNVSRSSALFSFISDSKYALAALPMP